MSDLTTPQARVQVALELTELAERMLRQRLRRTRPGVDDAEIEREVNAWYMRRPGAEHGDGVGQPIDPRERFG